MVKLEGNFLQAFAVAANVLLLAPYIYNIMQFRKMFIIFIKNNRKQFIFLPQLANM